MGETALLSLFHLLVEEPLVDLDPREARRLHSALALLAIELATRLRVQAPQIVDLLCAFAQAVRHEDGRAGALLSHAFSRDHRQL